MMTMKLWSSSKSQSFQESFVLNVTEELVQGYYLEVGSNHPIEFNNTYILETAYGWKGMGIELSKNLVSVYKKVRTNAIFCDDALTFDYKEKLETLSFPPVLDYLQLDIEPASQTFSALLRIPLNDFVFRVITFEHDLYANPSNIYYKDRAFEYLISLGYKRVVDNVKSNGKPFEDWYVHPQFTSERVVKDFYAKDIEDWELFQNSILT